MKSKIAVVAAATLLLGTLAAWSAGMFFGFPIVGGASYCSTSTGSAGTQVCTTTIPAGPSIVTGSELVPADTALTGGARPQTVLLPMASLNALPYTYGQYTTGQTITVSANIGSVVLSPQNGLNVANLNIQMPASVIDGQQLNMSFTNGIASLLVSPNTGQNVASPQTLVISLQTGAVAGTQTPQLGGIRYIYRAANTTWYRL